MTSTSMKTFKRIAMSSHTHPSEEPNKLESYKSLHFSNSLEAWETINEAFLKQSNKEIIYQSGQVYITNLAFTVDKPYLPEDINFGRYFHYHKAKWVALVKNYLSMEELDEIKEALNQKLGDTPISYQFHNQHKSGKGCLLSMTIMYSEKKFHFSFHIRSSEVTKRLIFDLLLFQRIGEYLLEGKPFDFSVFITKAFNTPNVLLMYHVHNNLYELLGRYSGDWYTKVRKNLKYFLEHGKDDIKYKIEKRVAKVLKKDEGQFPQFTVKDCKLPL